MSSVKTKTTRAPAVLKDLWAPERIYNVAALAPAPLAELIKEEISCDRCAAPGMCCRAMNVSKTFPRDWGVERVQADIRSNIDSGGRKYDMLIPIRRTGDYGPEREMHEVHWLFSCNLLTPSGRCGDYDNRPDMCREYVAGTDRMCIHYRGKDGRAMVPQLPEKAAS